MSRLSRILEASDTHGKELQFFIDNPSPDDKKREDNGISDMLTAELATVGAYILSQEKDTSELDKDQLDIGMEVEMEHLPKDGAASVKERIAKVIATAHIIEASKENKKYYYRDKNGKAKVVGENAEG